jgi:hypothetical protein
MKKNLINKLVITSALFIGLSSCDKETQDTTPLRDIPNEAYVQWINATVNSSNRNFIFVNGVRTNGTGVAYGSTFPASSYAFAVFPGTTGINVRDTLVTSTQLQNQFVHDFAAGKNYTVFTYDTITNPKKIVVENNFELPEDGTARLRFANLIYSATAVPNVDVFSLKSQTNVFTNIPAATVTNFIPFNAATSDTLSIRQTGTSTELVRLPVNLNRKRSYTAVYRGSHRPLPTTTPKTATLHANN